MPSDSRFSQRSEWAEGQPISELMSTALANPELISLAAGFVDQQTLPVEPCRAAMEAILANPDEAKAALQYGTTPGYPPLREALLARHLAADNISASQSNVSIDRFIVTAGSNQLLHLVAESLLDPGDIVICAAPTYLVFLGTLSNLGVRTVGVATDAEGIIVEALDETFKRLEAEGELPRVKAIYVVSYSDNPAGITMPVQRRAKVVEIAKRWSSKNKIRVIDDAAYRELRYYGDDFPSLAAMDDEGDTVIVAGTFSKPFSPGIRVGWGILPEDLVEPVCNQKGNIDFGSPNLNQHLMSKVLELDLFDSHVRALCESYRTKLETMLSAAEEFLKPIDGIDWINPAGGLYVWLRLPEGTESGPSSELFQQAMKEGMFYVPGEYCYPLEGEPVRRNRIRLSFGVQSNDKIREGMAALGRATRFTLV